MPDATVEVAGGGGDQPAAAPESALLPRRSSLARVRAKRNHRVILGTWVLGPCIATPLMLWAGSEAGWTW